MENTNTIRSKILLGAIGLVLFIGFVALGSWQVKRMYWKQALIERVDQRIHSSAVSVPERERWSSITAESDAYRHVRVNGIFLNSLDVQVTASTRLGSGFWVMTPLRQSNGSIIFINRGFIPSGTRPCPSVHGVIEVTGLLRMSEPGGGFLRPNNPALSRWYSRDIQAIAANHNLSDVAPFFIDAELGKTPDSQAPLCRDPVAGLTVTTFQDNHLAYALTWYAMALMVAAACFYTGLRWRRNKVQLP